MRLIFGTARLPFGRFEEEFDIKSPIKYYGGKTRLAKWIVENLEQYEHVHYVEPFCGSAAVLFAKEPVKIETINDLDGRLVNFYRVIAKQKTFDEFKERVEAEPYSRKVYYEARKLMYEPGNASPVDLAVAYYVCNRQGFGGKITKVTGWGYGIGPNRAHTKTWQNSFKRLPEVQSRISNLQIECLPAVEIIKKYDAKETLFYIDPPYVADTRAKASTKVYFNEMDDQDHTELVETILQIKGNAALSGYESDLYKPLLDAGWTVKKRDNRCSSQNQRTCNQAKANRVESLYLSPV